MGRGGFLLLLLVGCRQIFGFDDPIVSPPPDADSLICVPGCSDDTPICASGTCRGCTAHAECPSATCLDDGTCADGSEVAFVDEFGVDSAECTSVAPCRTVSAAITTGRPVVKVNGFITEPSELKVQRDVTIVATVNSTVTRTTMGDLFVIEVGNVKISDLQVFGVSGHGIAIDSGTVTITRSFIHNNGSGLRLLGGSLVMSRCVIASNGDVGAVINAASQITNSVFVVNGGPLSAGGGLRINFWDANSRFEFNTVADNISEPASADRSGIACVTGVLVRNSIVSGNQLAPTCAAEYSLFDVAQNGLGNVAGIPAYIDTTSEDVRSKQFYRVLATSPAIDRADPTATLSNDIDGDTRPLGSNHDIGADEAR